MPGAVNKNDKSLEPNSTVPSVHLQPARDGRSGCICGHAVLITATYSATPTTKPPQEISIGANILLDASTATDMDGDPVTTTWSLLEKPAASLANLTISGNNARFSADAPGTYRVLAHASDPLGAYSETIYFLDAQNRAPGKAPSRHRSVTTYFSIVQPAAIQKVRSLARGASRNGPRTALRNSVPAQESQRSSFRMR